MSGQSDSSKNWVLTRRTVEKWIVENDSLLKFFAKCYSGASTLVARAYGPDSWLFCSRDHAHIPYMWHSPSTKKGEKNLHHIGG